MFASSLPRAAAAVALLAAGLAAAPAKADSVTAFYKGNTVTILLGTGPGATYDFYARILANHMPRHIPGNPTMVVQYMPGAGGVRAFNYLYNAAPKDGTVFANVFGTLPANQLLRADSVQYDALKFNWLGSVSRIINIVVVRHDAPATTLEDAKQAELVIGTLGRGNNTHDFPALVNEVVGTRMRLITGYPSGAEIYKAMEGGEVHGYAPVWLSLVTVKPDWLRDGYIRMLVQGGLSKLPELPDVPLLLDLAESEEHRQMVRFVAAASPIGRASALPPGVPAERVAAMEKAFAATMEDPAFLAEIKQRNLTAWPMSKEEIVEAVRSVVETPPHIVERLQQVVGQ